MIVDILIARKNHGNIERVRIAAVEKGGGVVGDRYNSIEARKKGMAGVTLIAMEDIEAFNREYDEDVTAAELRRNIVCRGINLSELIGRKILIGADVVGIVHEYCEPCYDIVKNTSSKIIKGMHHRAGVRVEIINSGTIDCSNFNSIIVLS